MDGLRSRLKDGQGRRKAARKMTDEAEKEKKTPSSVSHSCRGGSSPGNMKAQQVHDTEPAKETLRISTFPSASSETDSKAGGSIDSGFRGVGFLGLCIP